MYVKVNICFINVLLCLKFTQAKSTMRAGTPNVDRTIGA